MRSSDITEAHSIIELVVWPDTLATTRLVPTSTHVVASTILLTLTSLHIKKFRSSD